MNSRPKIDPKNDPKNGSPEHSRVICQCRFHFFRSGFAYEID